MDALFIALLVILGITVVGLISLVIYISRMDKKPKESETATEPVTEEEAPVEVPAAEEVVEEEPMTEETPVEEPVAEETVEEEPVAEEAPAEEPVEEELEEEDESSEVEEEEQTITEISENGVTRIIVIRYNKSFTAKLIQSDDRVKNYYSEIKNCLLSYSNVKNRMSWKWESFRIGRKTIAKIRMRGKTLSLVLALDPTQFENTKYLVESVADIASYADTPSLYRIKNDRRLQYAKELIEKLLTEEGVEVDADVATVDYAKEFPYEDTPQLIKRELIKEHSEEKISA